MTTQRTRELIYGDDALPEAIVHAIDKLKEAERYEPFDREKVEFAEERLYEAIRHALDDLIDGTPGADNKSP